MPRKITDAEAARIAHGQREIDRERLSEDALAGLRSLPLSGPDLDRARTKGPVTLSGWYAADVDGRACWVEYGEVGSLGAKALRGYWLGPIAYAVIRKYTEASRVDSSHLDREVAEARVQELLDSGAYGAEVVEYELDDPALVATYGDPSKGET